MNLSFHYELSSRSSSDGRHSILIRCSQNRKHRRISTGILVRADQWNNDLKQVKRGHPTAKEYNKLLLEKLKKVMAAYTRLLEQHDEVNLDDVVQELSRNPNTNFFDFAYSTKMAEVKNSNKLGTYRRYEVVLNKLKVYAGHNLSINRMNYSFLKDYARYLSQDLKNTQDTVSANLSVIRTILNEADRRGLHSGQNPFNQLSLKYTDNTKQKLTAAELDRIFTTHLPNIPSVLLARDFFLACFLAEGCRAGDMIQMTQDQVVNGHLVYRQTKTGKQMATPIGKELHQILTRHTGPGKYIFPFLEQEPVINEIIINSKVTYINKYLKEVAKYCGIFKKLSTHVSRHTYTDLALQATSGNIYQVQQSLGHSSVRTTELYTRQSVNFQRTSAVGQIMELVKGANQSK
jgi:integrase/recombinase XerD